MSPFLQRKLRAMSTALVIFLCCAVAGALAWKLRQYELSREAKPTPASRVLDDVFAAGSSKTDDKVLLTRLLSHRSEAIDDAEYVNQVRRLMVNTQQIEPARTFLRDVERRRTINPDELTAQIAWVDLEASHQAWTNGDEAKAATLLASAIAAANELRVKWPEWSLPYRILEEASRADWVKSTADQSTDYSALERTVRSRIWNGAFVRSLTDWQPIVAVFLVSLIGLLGLYAAINALLANREMAGLTSQPIASTQPGYVELRGTLQVLSNTTAVTGPFSKQRGVWYELASRDGFKKSRTHYERSAQPFVLRDTSGEAVIEPAGMTVHTRHSAASLGNDSAFNSNRHSSERMLKENDDAYVLGELSVSTAPNGTTQRTVRVAQDGRQLLVSNFSEEQLVFFGKIWLWIGLSVFLLGVLMLTWAFHQRYHITTFPGVLQ